jgi:hypothetical protein
LEIVVRIWRQLINSKAEGRWNFRGMNHKPDARSHKDNPFSDNLHESGYGIIFTPYNTGLPVVKFPYR